jgi:type IV secretory pathway VirB4 component
MKNSAVSNRVVYIDPSLHPQFSPSINPFEIEDRSEKNIALMTQELRSIFEVLLQDVNTTNQMSALLSPCIATLLRRPGSGFSDLQRFMDDKNNHDLVTLGSQSPNLQHRSLFQTRFYSKMY